MHISGPLSALPKHTRSRTSTGPKSSLSSSKGPRGIGMSRRSLTQILFPHGTALPQVCTADLASNTSRPMPWLISAGRLGRGARAASLPYSRGMSTNCSRPLRCWGPSARGPRRETLLPVTSPGPDEQQRRIAAANAAAGVSDDAIRALETAAAGAAGQSLASSVSVAEHDASHPRGDAIIDESPNHTATTSASEVADVPSRPQPPPTPLRCHQPRCLWQNAAYGWRARTSSGRRRAGPTEEGAVPAPRVRRRQRDTPACQQNGVCKTQDAQCLPRLPQHEGPVQPVTLGLRTTWPHSVYGREGCGPGPGPSEGPAE